MTAIAGRITPLHRRLAVGPGAAMLIVADVATLGFITLGFEMVASRILTPLFGSGIYTWATIISIVVAGLMAGYFMGGFIADRFPTFTFAATIKLAAAAYLIVVFAMTPGGLVIGNEAVYCDISAEIPHIERVEPDPGLLTVLREAIPEALVLPIGTSATVGGSAGSPRNIRVEAMEGFAVLRACALAGVPAIEVRAISNEVSEGDRSRWRVGRALEAISDALPRLLAALAE